MDRKQNPKKTIHQLKIVDSDSFDPLIPSFAQHPM